MTSSGDFNAQNFQWLVENYESTVKDVSGDLEAVQEEQKALKKALKENTQLSHDLRNVLAERAKGEVEHKFQESELVQNLKLQLKLVNEEKDQAIKLWQNAASAVEQLEHEVKAYQQNTEGFIPKSKLTELKNSYEEKLNELQASVFKTKAKLEETINLRSKELHVKDKEITGNIQIHDNSLKIIKNLEEEVLNLQERLNSSNADKRKLEKELKSKNAEVELLKIKVKECKAKVEEAILVVEAALNEKDAALMREAEAQDATAKLSQTLNEFIDETDEKIKSIRHDHDSNLQQMKQALQANQELLKLKESEIENYAKKCELLESELEKAKNSRLFTDESATSKMLTLEKNLENTFQKLLLSEKQNIQLRGEMESLKNDLDQMAQHYERDINTREAEKTVLKSEIQKLKTDLDQSYLQITESTEIIYSLNEKISSMEMRFKEQIKETKDAVQQTNLEREETEAVHKKIVQELQEQLLSQIVINKKWRNETKIMTEQLEKIITELKIANNKTKLENKMLNEKLKETNLQMLEYRKFLEMISQDVTKITSITLPTTKDTR